MATIRERARGDGGTTYTVLWWAGGKRGGKQESETFRDLPQQAEVFKGLVNMHGQNWPPGWVRGKGFVKEETAAAVGADVPLVDWCLRRQAKTTGLASRTRKMQVSAITLHLSRIVHTEPNGTVVPATVANITEDDIADWVRAEEEGQPDPARPGKWTVRPARPASVHLRHGLLSGYLAAAMRANPPLRTDNPCTHTRLPRIDTGKVDEEMCFLEQDEYQRIRHELARKGGGDAAEMADLLVGTGMRWGEAVALQIRDLHLDGAAPHLTVNRAMRLEADGTRTLQAPKSAAGRRMIDLPPSLVEMLRRRCVGRAAGDTVMLTCSGAAWNYTNFRQNRWRVAVQAAMDAGLPRRPRIHDLRHTHVAWLIAARIPLPAIKRRLGHESIKTTIDRYGHLSRELNAEIAAAVEASMAPVGNGELRLVSG